MSSMEVSAGQPGLPFSPSSNMAPLPLPTEFVSEKVVVTHTSLVGLDNRIATLKNTLAVSLKTKYATSIQPRNWIPEHLSQRSEGLCSYENPYMNIYSCFIHNSQKLETTICPLIHKWLNKLWYIHTMEYYLLKRKILSIHSTNYMNGQRIVLSEKKKKANFKGLNTITLEQVIPFI